jgi:hypothetical protein
MKKQTLLDKCFKDNKGNVALAQKLNLPLGTWVATSLVGLYVKTGTLGEIIDIVGFGALFTWAWLELFQGVNYLRRTFGLIIIIYSIYSRLY